MAPSDLSRNRPLLPALQRSRPPAQSSRTPLPRQHRAGVSIACEFCRKRKTRCNGARPQCASCAKNGVACTYNLPMRVHKLRQHIGVLETEQEANRRLIELLRYRTPSEATLILDFLRQDTSVHSIIRQVEVGDMLCNLSHRAGNSCSRR
ncbi:hypothetical protein NXS19_002511 [Fusarium pseudograminearum]|nr:hypothetical protein NXS19_002511 [Fusarium pseudograminearum]